MPARDQRAPEEYPPHNPTRESDSATGVRAAQYSSVSPPGDPAGCIVCRQQTIPSTRIIAPVHPGKRQEMRHLPHEEEEKQQVGLREKNSPDGNPILSRAGARREYLRLQWTNASPVSSGGVHREIDEQRHECQHPRDCCASSGRDIQPRQTAHNIPITNPAAV